MTGFPAIDKLHPSVEIYNCCDSGLELHDRRTGFRVQVDFPPNGNSDEIGGLFETTLESFGLCSESTVEAVRTLQRPIRDQLQNALRLECLEETITHAVGSVPFYRARVDVYGGLTATGTAIDFLRCLPILRKDDIRNNVDQLISEHFDIRTGLTSGQLRIARTSGTTDERIQVLSDMSLSRVPPDYEAVWRLCHGDKIPRTAVLTTPVCSAAECRLGRAPMTERIRYGYTLYLNSTEDLFSATDQLVMNVVAELEAFAPEFILANPVYLHWIARRANELGLTLPRPELILSSYQFLSQCQRRALQELFGAPVYNVYAATEHAGSEIAVECKNAVWHVREDHVLVEVAESSMHPLAVGNLLVTTFNRLMPLIRHEVGDLGRLVDHDCDCALSDWRGLEFHGRMKDVLRIGHQHLTTRQVDDVIGSFVDIDFYQCQQVGDNEMLVVVVPASGATVPPHQLGRALSSTFGVESVVVRIAQRLEPEPSLKFRLTVPLPSCH